jgi:thiol-disulfide isomerase/thioredoxin
MRRLVTLALALAAMACMGGQTSRPAVKVGNARTDQSKAEATKLREALVGKPLVVQGKTLSGQEFSTASLKGKVVLVDFWASWCPDCQAELPKVLETYRKYHGQGLEILGVSSDVTAGDFQDYLKGHPEVSWTELWTPPLENGRHPLNTVYGVDWIPTVFIIDKAGVCRSVKGSAEMEKLLPELLKEK